jgi:glutamate-1-semialdehyde 2,1-aminomutase
MTSEEHFRRAERVIPGGVNSPVRAWKAVGGTPRFIVRGSGAWVWDTEDHRYLDVVGSWGPLILGHAHPAVVAAVSAAAEHGTSFGAPTTQEIELAELIVAALPGADQVRLVSSGTEALMTAIRLARGHTGRRRIVKFAGCYHGHSDGLLVKAGSGALTMGMPDSLGVPPEIAGLTAVATFNDLQGVREIFSRGSHDVAAVVVEPVAANMGTVPAGTGFLEGLRQLTIDNGALLIFDEVITGFRVAWGGAQRRLGVKPDLTCLGKVIGGGLPLAALAGRRDMMQGLAPVGSVYQAGTLSGNPIAVAAGLATLRHLASGRAYERLEHLGALLEQQVERELKSGNTPAVFNRFGSLFTVFLGVETVQTFAHVLSADTEAFGRFFRALLERGIYYPPSQFEAAFLSLAHTEGDVACLATAIGESLRDAL